MECHLRVVLPFLCCRFCETLTTQNLHGWFTWQKFNQLPFLFPRDSNSQIAMSIIVHNNGIIHMFTWICLRWFFTFYHGNLQETSLFGDVAIFPISWNESKITVIFYTWCQDSFNGYSITLGFRIALMIMACCKGSLSRYPWIPFKRIGWYWVSQVWTGIKETISCQWDFQAPPIMVFPYRSHNPQRYGNSMGPSYHKGGPIIGGLWNHPWTWESDWSGPFFPAEVTVQWNLNKMCFFALPKNSPSRYL